MSSPFQCTQKYQRVPGPDGNRYRFYCDISGALFCETAPYRESDPDEELRKAWETEGRPIANQCHHCGRFVIDAMYNADVFQCVDCAPWEDKPNYCLTCGNRVHISDTYCTECGSKLWYGTIGEPRLQNRR